MTTPDPRWDARFLELAHHVAGWSRDPTTKVGAVIVGETKADVCFGYNGLPPGIADDDRLDDREWKNLHVIHAEENALINCLFRPVTLYCSRAPCVRCAMRIIAHKVVRVVAPLPMGEFAERWGAQVLTAVNRFAEAGVRVDLVGPGGWNSDATLMLR